ncbi:hypothetical protein XELAEV_18012843mg [Xenopus laevis]|uniref:Protein kinase domain-containing protein n=1 Tax=Xenopus laevis TaxID=8355 RepID=A0A974DNB9_XENLA|nr:hypothetical protein XELAEV_18012843mg [Xenopus laevis]
MDISEPLVSICVKANAYEPPAMPIQGIEGPSNSVFKEKKILQRICEAEHPFLVSLHGTFQTDSHLFFAMEYLPGGDMCDFITCVELQESDVMFYTACIVLDLEALHKMGIIHRDLKLENLMLDQGGYLKIIDFGLSKDRFGYTDRTNTMCGTRTYMAPEMFMLLEKDPDYRLGSGEAGAEVIKAHPFFRDIDWEQLLHRKTKPPYVFNNQDHLESFNNPECQAPALTTPAVKIPSELQEAFREFDYTPD